MRVNLLNETISFLNKHNKTEKDVLWVSDLGKPDKKATWEQFANVADFEYDNGYGGAEVSTCLVIVGNGWWIERAEYDGSEWWEYKSIPKCVGDIYTPLISVEEDWGNGIVWGEKSES